MKSVKSMSDREILNELQSQSLLARVRAILSSSAGEIEQACAQRRMPSPIEIKRMEFAAAEKIIELIETEQEAICHPVMYACGYEVAENEFGMFAGPTPSLRQILNEVVDGDDGNQVPAYVLKIEANREPEKIAHWNYGTSTWDNIESEVR